MRRSFFRPAIIGAFALCLALLGGCSALRWGYQSGPQLAYWWLDRYVDFDETQAPRAREAIGAWFDWHRGSQLPDYADLLAQARAEVSEHATPTQACRWLDAMTLRFDRAVDHAMPRAADMARTLSTEQLDHMQRKYAKNNEAFRRDFLQSDPEDRLRMQIKRVNERAELLYGRLTDAQRERIAELTAQSPFDPQAWLMERQQRQRDTLESLRALVAARGSAAEAEAAMRVLYEHTMRSPRPAYRAYQQRLQAFNCDFAAQVHNLSTPQQRLHAAQRFARWEADLRALGK